MKLEVIRCLRCSGDVEPMRNGSLIYVHCESPACGVIWPVDTVRAELAKEASGFGDDPEAVVVPGGRVRRLQPDPPTRPNPAEEL